MHACVLTKVENLHLLPLTLKQTDSTDMLGFSKQHAKQDSYQASLGTQVRVCNAEILFASILDCCNLQHVCSIHYCLDIAGMQVDAPAVQGLHNHGQVLLLDAAANRYRDVGKACFFAEVCKLLADDGRVRSQVTKAGMRPLKCVRVCRIQTLAHKVHVELD